MRIRTTVVQSGKNTTGLAVPESVVLELGKGRKPPVRVTINGHTYRSSVAAMGGEYMISLSAENRAAAGVQGGDQVDVDIELDTEKRQVVVPDDLSEALDADPATRNYFEALSYSNQRRHVMAIEAAKAPETRRRRIEKSISLFREGKN